MLLLYRCTYFNLFIFLFALRTLELDFLRKMVQDSTPDVFTIHIHVV